MNADEARVAIKLSELSELYAQRDLLGIDKARLVEEATPPEVREAIADIELEFGVKEAAVDDAIQVLTAEIKAAVARHGASVKGDHLHAVYSKPRVSWDTKGLEGYSLAHPEIAVFRKFGKPSVSLRRI